MTHAAWQTMSSGRVRGALRGRLPVDATVATLDG
jgi:hypothetical protein